MNLGRWSLVVALACVAGCGDNLHRADDGFAPVGGTRLALQKYRYDDGTELAVASEFYDLHLHVRCTPQPWRDGIVRCVPSAEDAVFSDPGCTTLVGLARTIAMPTHFLVHDTLPTARIVTHVFRSGATTAAIPQYWTTVGGACVGPTPAPAGQVGYFALSGELDAGDLVVVRDAEIGDGRLGLALRETDDGLRVVSGLRDRALGGACVATRRGDGGVACEPVDAAAATYFGDPACRAPVVAVTAAVPAAVRIAEPSGCPSYHRIGPEVSPPVYLRDGDACTPVDASALGRLFAVGAPIDLPALGRTVEDVPGRRLQRVILDPGSGVPRVTDDRLFDTATATDCRPRTLRNVIRCVPPTVAATTLFAAGCTTQVPVAEVPQHSCERAGYATAARPFQIRAIGDVVPGGLFHFDNSACQPYTGAPGNELRALGPSLDLTTFEAAIYFGERSL